MKIRDILHPRETFPFTVHVNYISAYDDIFEDIYSHQKTEIEVVYRHIYRCLCSFYCFCLLHLL